MTPPIRSHSHLILVPSYNSGRLLAATVRAIVRFWQPVWVIIDGSTDQSADRLTPLLNEFPEALKIIILPQNVGKGAAILQGIEQASQQGFTHVLTMDADLQHDPESIYRFMQRSFEHPHAMVLGTPVFDASAPQIRVQGRKLSNGMAYLETLGWGIKDALFGMRLYPIPALINVMHGTRWARRFDFEPEVAVRLAWQGVPALNLATPVRYITQAEGGVSQFKYLRDNSLLIWMHLRLLTELIVHLPKLVVRKFQKNFSQPSTSD